MITKSEKTNLTVTNSESIMIFFLIKLVILKSLKTKYTVIMGATHLRTSPFLT